MGLIHLTPPQAFCNSPVDVFLNASGQATLDPSLSAGTYSITATDEIGCTKTISVTITQPATITFSTSQCQYRS